MAEPEHCIVLTTTDGEQAAAELAREVVEAGLAACVQVLGVRSVYRWQGAIEDAPEQLVLIKTRADLYERLEEFIRARHSYAVPEILRVPVTGGLGDYLAWIDESTRSPGTLGS